MQVSSTSAMTVKSSKFLNNSAADQAGVAYVVGVLSMSDCVLTNNTAIDGGAFALNFATLYLRNCSIAGNSARDRGGAVYSTDSNVTATNTAFTGNSAVVGGACSSSGGTLALDGCNLAANRAHLGGALHMSSGWTAALTSARFANNKAVLYGGAISSIQGGNTSLEGCTFTGNRVTTLGGSGGALHYLGAHIRVTASATHLEGNRASYGGALASICPSFVVLIDQLVHNPLADVGGASPFPHYRSAIQLIWAALNTAVSLDACESSLTLSLCSFKNNTARLGGGAAYVANGAGVNSSSSEFLLNNARTGFGGGVLLESNSSLRCSNTSFRENWALQGGAVAATQSAKASFSGGCVFSGNKARVGGGALVVDGARVVLEDSKLRKNKAQQGGALLARNVAEVTLGGGVQLVGNAARLFGGGMVVDFECSLQVPPALVQLSVAGSQYALLRSPGYHEQRT
jgi:predicted outer membrane repeat protein